MTKKYYLISEVQQILAVPTHKLRYLEKITNKLNIFKIKGRRYYTTKDIEYLKNYLTPQKNEISEKYLASNNSNESESFYDNMNNKIDNLINKFKKLAEEVSVKT